MNYKIMDIIKRSELINMAKREGIDPNDYILQVVRVYPNIIILNDLSFDESLF